MIANIKLESDKLKSIVTSTKSIVDLKAELYALENDITVEDAKEYLNLQNTNSKLLEKKEIIEEIYNLEQKEYKTLDDYAKIMIDKSKLSGNMGMYAGGTALSALSSSVQGSDVGNFLQGMAESGSWIGGLINSIIGAFASVASSCDEFNKALNPITALVTGLKPIISEVLGILADVVDGITEILNIIQPFLTIIQGIIHALRLIGKAVNFVISLLGEVGEILNTLLLDWLQPIIDWFDSAFSFLERFIDTKKEEKDLTAQINEQYKSLLGSMQAQEEYYLSQKQKLLSDDYVSSIYNPRKVNDMILTDKGVFSTDPKDTIMAMKNPASLMNGGSRVLQPIVNDYAGVNVEVQENERADGLTELVINISKKVAMDFVEGTNGWDNAVKYRQARDNGRSVFA